jgi:hypothetical protein
MSADLLAHRVVELIEGAAFPHLDPAVIIGVIALVLAGAGLVTVRDYALGGGDRLPLLVAEPFPRIVAALGGLTEPVERQLRRVAQHPAVDAVIVVTTAEESGLLPRRIDGVPIRAAVAGARAGQTAT